MSVMLCPTCADREALRAFQENSRNFDAEPSESDDEDQKNEDDESPSTDATIKQESDDEDQNNEDDESPSTVATIKQEPQDTDDAELLRQFEQNTADMADEARAYQDIACSSLVEDTDTLSDNESELSELSEAELLRRFEEIDGRELLKCEDENKNNEDVQYLNTATSAAAINQEPTDTSRDGLAVPAFPETPRHLANEAGLNDEFLQTALNLDNLQYPLEPAKDTPTSQYPLETAEDTLPFQFPLAPEEESPTPQYLLELDEEPLPPQFPLDLVDYLARHHFRPDYDTLPPPLPPRILPVEPVQNHPLLDQLRQHLPPGDHHTRPRRALPLETLANNFRTMAAPQPNPQPNPPAQAPATNLPLQYPVPPFLVNTGSSQAPNLVQSNIGNFVPQITIRAGRNNDDRPWAYECDLCGARLRVTGDFNRHQRVGSQREGFRIVRAVPGVEMRWYGIDDWGYLYVGNIIRVGKDKLQRQGGIKMPCGPNVRAAKAAKAAAKA